MERILTQEEIDELLLAFDDGQIEPASGSPADGMSSAAASRAEKRVSSIDLIRGQNYSKWRIANLDIVFNSFARYYSIALSNSLQQGVTVSRAEILSRFFEDFLVSQEKAGLLGVMSLEPLKGNALIVYDKALCFGMVEVMFGMPGGVEFMTFDRDVSAIEANIIKGLMAEGCRVFNRAFEPLEQLATRITRAETNWKMLNILAPETEVIQVSFFVKVGDLEGKIQLVIPYFSLEPFKERLRNEGLQLAEDRKEASWSRFLTKEAEKMEISVSAVWGDLILTIGEILSLDKGDIIGLDYDEQCPVTVMAGAQPKFGAQPGVKDGKKVVRLVKQEVAGE